MQKSLSLLTSYLVCVTYFQIYKPIGIVYFLLLQISLVKYFNLINLRDCFINYDIIIKYHNNDLYLFMLLLNNWIIMSFWQLGYYNNVDFFTFVILSLILIFLQTKSIRITSISFIYPIQTYLTFWDFYNLYSICTFLYFIWFLIRQIFISILVYKNYQKMKLFGIFAIFYPNHMNVLLIFVEDFTKLDHVRTFFTNPIYLRRNINILLRFVVLKNVEPQLQIKTKLIYFIAQFFCVYYCIQNKKSSYCYYYIFLVVAQLFTCCSQLYLLSNLTHFKLNQNLTEQELFFELQSDQRADFVQKNTLEHLPNNIADMVTIYDMEEF